MQQSKSNRLALIAKAAKSIAKSHSKAVDQFVLANHCPMIRASYSAASEADNGLSFDGRPLSI